jgi:hypothetical protein
MPSCDGLISNVIPGFNALTDGTAAALALLCLATWRARDAPSLETNDRLDERLKVDEGSQSETLPSPNFARFEGTLPPRPCFCLVNQRHLAPRHALALKPCLSQERH